jgi:hypothetical protein
MKLGFLDIFSKNTEISNSKKISPVEAEFHADGRADRQTDMAKLIVAFRYVANTPEGCTFYPRCIYVLHIFLCMYVQGGTQK